MRRLAGLLLALVMLCSMFAPSMTVRADTDSAEAGAVLTETEEEKTEPEDTEPEDTEPEETEPEETEPEDNEQDEPVQPAQMKFSDAGIAFIKSQEGFVKYPVEDYGQYTVGYGTRCPDDMLNHYRVYGITEAEAEVLLRNYISSFERYLKSYIIDRYNVTYTQQQYDALISFTFNVGPGWMTETGGTFHQAVVRGATGNELIRAFSLWCVAGGINSGLLRRRLCEANMYLNGVYSGTAPSNYGYVYFNGNGGSVSNRVQGYDANLDAPILTTAYGHSEPFAGWYTAAVGGEKVEQLTEDLKGRTLYAHWGDGTQEQSNLPGPVNIVVTGNGVNLRNGPGTNYGTIGVAYAGHKLIILRTAEGSGYTWGQFESGWICLLYTDFDKAYAEQYPEVEEPTDEPTEPPVDEPTDEPTEPPTEEPTNAPTEPPTEEPTEPPTEAPTEPDEPEIGLKGPVNVRVTGDGVYKRSGPGTGYGVVGFAWYGDKLTITETAEGSGYVWGKFNGGWICLQYTDFDKAYAEQYPDKKEEPTEPPVTEPPATEPPATEPPKPAKVMGTVKVNDYLCVRSGPSTGYSVVDYLKPNARVEILEQKTVGHMTWGRISKGWISMSYVVLDAPVEEPTTPPATEPAPTEPAQPATVTGTVKVNDYLCIRSGPGTSYAVVNYYTGNTKVTILEQKNTSSGTWGKTDKGWISMGYVVLDQASSTPAKVTKTVTADCLLVRKAAGTGNVVVGYLYYGAKVEILEQTTVAGQPWGRISNGWICLSYTK